MNAYPVNILQVHCNHWLALFNGFWLFPQIELTEQVVWSRSEKDWFDDFLASSLSFLQPVIFSNVREVFLSQSYPQHPITTSYSSITSSLRLTFFQLPLASSVSLLGATGLMTGYSSGGKEMRIADGEFTVVGHYGIWKAKIIFFQLWDMLNLNNIR